MKSADTKTAIKAEQLIAMFALDAPIPVRVLYGLYGSRSSFSRWKKQGLAIFHVEGMGPAIVPSVFRAFLMQHVGSIKPDTPPPSVHPAQ